MGRPRPSSWPPGVHPEPPTPASRSAYAGLSERPDAGDQVPCSPRYLAPLGVALRREARAGGGRCSVGRRRLGAEWRPPAWAVPLGPGIESRLQPVVPRVGALRSFPPSRGKQATSGPQVRTLAAGGPGGPSVSTWAERGPRERSHHHTGWRQHRPGEAAWAVTSSSSLSSPLGLSMHRRADVPRPLSHGERLRVLFAGSAAVVPSWAHLVPCQQGGRCLGTASGPRPTGAAGP